MTFLTIVVAALVLTPLGVFGLMRPHAIGGLVGMRRDASPALVRITASVMLLVGLACLALLALGAWGAFLIIHDPSD